MILVDTNVLSELTRPMPEPRVVAWLEVNEPALALLDTQKAVVRQRPGTCDTDHKSLNKTHD